MELFCPLTKYDDSIGIASVQVDAEGGIRARGVEWQRSIRLVPQVVAQFHEVYRLGLPAYSLKLRGGQL